MPFVRISVPASLPQATRRAIPSGVHRALVQAIGIPEGDRFQLVVGYSGQDGFFDPSYLGVARRDVVAIEITLVRGRSAELKRALYQRITDELVAAGVRSEDVFVTLTENGPADWSVGNGRAQLLEADPPRLLAECPTVFGPGARNRIAAVADPGPAGAYAALETFYHAFNSADVELIRTVWLDDPLAQLSNPLGGVLRGRDAIAALYRKIFGGPIRPKVRFQDITVLSLGPASTVFVGRELGAYGDVDLAIRTTRCFVYAEPAGGWRQAHHHGSIDNAEQLRRYQDAVATAHA
jgi:phenylpyruvate tautomerase PptA (4-oxalocrotonate tautomerase family)/ketosteroid isomerase-like protein